MKKIFFVMLFLLVFAAPALADNATFSSPAEGEKWVRGTDRTITYTFTQEISWYALALIRNGTQVGTFSYHNYTYSPGVYNYTWKVGYIDEAADMAPPGSGYQIGFICGDAPCPVGISKKFTISFDFSLLEKIKKIYYVPLPKPNVCPQCIILDLAALREALIRLHEPVAAGLYLKGGIAANLGNIIKGHELSGKLQIKLEPDAWAAMKHGEEFELRLFNGHNQLIHSQAVLLVAAGR